MTNRDELKAQAEQLRARAKASAVCFKSLLHRLRSMQETAIEQIHESEAPRLAPE
jgi:hypothetical protein